MNSAPDFLLALGRMVTGTFGFSFGSTAGAVAANTGAVAFNLGSRWMMAAVALDGPRFAGLRPATSAPARRPCGWPGIPRVDPRKAARVATIALRWSQQTQMAAACLATTVCLSGVHE